MAKNTIHKYWFFVSYVGEGYRDFFYISVPILDKDALKLIGRVHSALKACFINAYVTAFPATKAYADIRKGIPSRSLEYALVLWRDILPQYYTKDALDRIFEGYYH